MKAIRYVAPISAAVAAALLARGLGADEPRRDGPMSPAEAAGRMRLPEGFQATLFAAEPDVVQPIAFTIEPSMCADESTI